VPGLGGGDDRDSQRGDPVGPPPSQPVVQREGDERQETGGRSDAAEGTIALQRTAGHLLAQAALGVSQGGKDGEGYSSGNQGDG